MIDRRLINAVPNCKKYIACHVISQWISLVANITVVVSIASLMQKLYENNFTTEDLLTVLFIGLTALLIRTASSIFTSKMGFRSSVSVKRTLRTEVYRKLLRLGSSYRENVNTSEIVQVAVEGIDQLDTYFGAYLPQFFYALVAPITLFFVLYTINVPAAVVLIICVPLIPVSIALVQTWAKKLLSKYWGQYTSLGDTFLENLQGLTTLKIYQSDAFKNDQMNQEAEQFRRITMRVLTMQLNSIIIMDIIAFGGAAAGIILAATQFIKGNITLAGGLTIILLAAEFFIPMRQLGSFFHIAMNGMAASKKIFRLLDLPEVPPADGQLTCEDNQFAHAENIRMSNLHFSYNDDRKIICGIDIYIPPRSFIAIVGESGWGKSTPAPPPMGRNKGYSGSITVAGIELTEIAEEHLVRYITYISHNSYLFKGTIRKNLLMGKPDATDRELWQVLEQTKLADFLRSEKGLDTQLNEKASNLSGGQCQRLALARALLHDSPIYIFDEAASNIDVESETDIMEQIYALAETKTVILISHRLANVIGADQIYVLEQGKVVETGTHTELLEKGHLYAKLWNTQQSLEKYRKAV